jgi:replicative DNA helicase
MSDAESAMIQVREIITNGRIRTMREMLFEVVAEFQAEMKGVSKGLAFGLEALDNITGGMRPGDMIVIAARPGMGKSALACQVAFDVVEQGGAVLIFSLEMECKQLVRRAFGVLGGVDTRKFGRREATQADFAKCGDVIERLKESQLVIDDTGGITANYIRAKALSLNRKNPLSLVIVDYLQLMSSESKSGENREREVAQISNKMKALAKELGCPVMTLCQLNRSADKERPRLTHLRESGAIEQDSDVVIAISAAETEENEYGIEKQNRPGDPFEVYVDVLKQRGGPIGECRMIFEPRNTRFVPVAYRSPIETTY